MIRALLTGTLYGEPQARTSKSGTTFATAKIRADAKDGSVLWISVVAFNELADRLLALHGNSAIAISGKLEVSAYVAKNGEPAAGLSVFCDELASLKARPNKPAVAIAPQPPAAGFDDDLNF
jgi:single-stranded DNA-binding protein